MMNYNYYEAMKEDIRNYINDEIEYTDFSTLEELEEHMNDVLWAHDSVTGNGSGSYTFNSYQAKEYVLDNIDLCREAVKEFCVDAETITDKFLYGDWEYFDVTIRCYILGGCIAEIMEEIEAEFNEAWEEMDDFREMED